tara:strand:- start:3642 stop:5384 length:1743 start_codon:yes stop_codon:yes gene_type:complete
MAVYYDSIKTMQTAKIGTILPWGGDGGEGFLASNIPRGWIVCDGKSKDAKDYPMLASVIGDTYGGDMTTGSPSFPYEDSTATFFTPQLSNAAMIDLERSHLDLAEYQYGQADAKDILKTEDATPLDLVKDYGDTTLIKSDWNATADIDFTLNLSGFLYFKFTGIKLSNPDFGETIYTVPRKLGINHTPKHSHPDSLQSVNPKGGGAMAFRNDAGVNMTGSASSSTCDVCNTNLQRVECVNATTEPTQWDNGRQQLTFYGAEAYEDTLPRMEFTGEYISDNSNSTANPNPNYWGTVPAGKDNWNTHHEGTARTANTPATRGSGHKEFIYEQNVYALGDTGALNLTEPVSTHATKCYTGLFPRPMEEQGRPNWYGYTDLTTTGNSAGTKGGLTDHPETFTPFDVDSVALSAATNEITLPLGTDIRRLYGASPNTWYQWDKIAPLMYVTTKEAKYKYKHFVEGTQVQKVIKEGSLYKVQLSQNIVTGGTVDLRFKWGTYGSSLNTSADNKNPLSARFGAHTHDSFEIAQTGGSMTDGNKIMTTYTANNANGSSLQAESIEDALNIVCDTTQPSLTCTFLIKAY